MGRNLSVRGSCSCDYITMNLHGFTLQTGVLLGDVGQKVFRSEGASPARENRRIQGIRMHGEQLVPICPGALACTWTNANM